MVVPLRAFFEKEIFRGVFRALSSTYDGVFLEKIVYVRSCHPKVFLQETITRDQNYKRPSMPKYDFNKVALELY